MARLAISTLGNFTAALDGETIHSFESDKVRALLVYLVVEGNRPHRREKLAALLWPEQNDEHARASLSQALYNLRHMLRDHANPIPFFIINNLSIQLNPQSQTWVDLNEFSQFVAACEAHPHRRMETCSECAVRLENAADLYRGDFLEGFHVLKSIPFEEWTVTTRERLNQQMLAILGKLQAYHESQGQLTQALRYAWQSVELDPLSEVGRRSLMRLLALDGQREAALLQYLKLEEMLNTELSVEPEQETQLLYDRLRKEVEKTHIANHLPAHLTPFIGRQAELAELCAILLDPSCRLVTIGGAGGSGKTRLALQAASRLQYHFTDDVCFVPLSGLQSEQSLLPAVALALHLKLQESSDPQTQLVAYLQGKQLLLLFDSFETVIAGAAWLSNLLRSTSGVKALVTSRMRLNIKGEHVFSLDGMKFPEREEIVQASLDPAAYSAMQLFVTAAQTSFPEMNLDQASWAEVAKICQQVQGMPLGLLLASAWLESYSLAEITVEIQRNLDFLETKWVGVPERQQSLRATLDYSYRLLNQQEQELFCKLSVFHGGFTRQAAVVVAAATAASLKGLLDKYMLQGQAGRYHMHDLVHQYAIEQLAQSHPALTTARLAHTQYYAALVQSCAANLKTSSQQKALEEMDLEIHNARQAWNQVIDAGDIDTLYRMVEGLCTYYELRRRYAEADTACQAALIGMSGREEPGAETLRGWLLAWKARFRRLVGDVECAKEMREASQSALDGAEAKGEDTRRGQALLSYELGYVTSSLPEQVEWFERSAGLYRSLADGWRQAGALYWAGELACRLGKQSLGMDLLGESVGLSRKAGEPRQLARALEMFAVQHLIKGQWEMGLRLMEEAVDTYRSVGDIEQEAIAHLHWGVSLLWAGRYKEGIESLGQALPLLRQVGNRFYIAYGTLALGIGQMYLGEYEQARRTLQAAFEAAQQDGFAREVAASLAMLGCLALAQGQPAQAKIALQDSVERYRIQKAAGELGVALGGLAMAELALGHKDLAHFALHEALGIVAQTHSHSTSFTCWAASVTLLAESECWEKTLEVYSAGQGVPLIANSHWQAEMVAPWIAAARAHLSPEAAEAALTRGRGRDLFALAAELPDEFYRMSSVK